MTQAINLQFVILKNVPRFVQGRIIKFLYNVRETPEKLEYRVLASFTLVTQFESWVRMKRLSGASSPALYIEPVDELPCGHR